MIIYFTGTGNSRFVAGRIAAATSDKLFDSALCIRKGEGADFTEPGDYVFVAPVYAAAPPLVFLDFIRRSHFPGNCHAYFVMVCAGSMGASPVYCRRAAEEKGLLYAGTAKVDMPQNYTAYFDVGTTSGNKRIIRAARPVIDGIASCIRGGRELPDPCVKMWMRVLTPLVLRPYYRFFVSAKQFRTNDRCVGCGKCTSLCPLNNIVMKERRPVWGSSCTHCMACINLCPADAIEYGRRTEGKRRYHGPDSLCMRKS